MLGRHLKSLAVNFGAMGLQYHMFGFKKPEDILGWANDKLNPKHVLACLDQYAKLGVPLNVSEITISAHPDFGDGLAFQREVAERLYRLWFSHPAVNGAIWWNLVDDTAYVTPTWNENIYKGGLLSKDLKPKPAYEALKRLVKGEWTTRTALSYENGASNKFHGFYGDYEALVETPSGSFKRRLTLSKGSLNKFALELD